MTVGAVLQGRYRILELVARGGMGVVYRAERLGLGRAVAIKFLHPDAAASVAVRRRFETEARAASRMNHPSCVSVIDFGLVEGAPYIVMDFVSGRTLRAMLDRGPLAVPRALALARQVLAGLAHAHARGIIHRDVKPENIFVTTDGMTEHAQLGDFGLAKMEAHTLSISRGMAIGTPGYMAPEQTLGLEVDARTDVYGAGILLFELLADRKPFHARRAFDTMALHREAPVPWFDDVAPDRAIPPELEAVVRRALAKAPADRYRDAGALARALDEAIAAARDAAAGDDVTELLARVRVRRTWRIAAAVLAALPLAALAWLLAGAPLP